MVSLVQLYNSTNSTVEGRVYKVVEWLDEDGESRSELLNVYEVTTPAPIRAMQISKKVRCRHYWDHLLWVDCQILYYFSLFWEISS